jgi:hypothetical protein
MGSVLLGWRGGGEGFELAEEAEELRVIGLAADEV